jgi:glycosyltransferase involved in cell wall biosynthesis
MNTKFSVLMPVYKNDDMAFLKRAIDSLLNSSVKPDEIIVVVDGPIPKALDDALKSEPDLTVHYFDKNRGLGFVLADGVKLCKNKLIARMDADDISDKDRFEKQVAYFEKNKSIDVLGGYIAEFDSDESNLKRERKVPLSHSDIINAANKRNPMNHVTVMFKKESVLKAGNYQDMLNFEDYYLWMRMLKGGSEFANLDDCLVNVRIAGLDNRRGGASYIKYEVKFFNTLLREKMIRLDVFLANMIKRVPVRLLGSGFRNFVYDKLLRK